MNKIKLNKCSYLSLAALVFTIASLILILVSNGVAGHGFAKFGEVVALAIISPIAVLATGALSVKFGGHHFATVIAGGVAIILITATLGSIIFQRSAMIAAQFTYDKVNQIGWKALIPSLIAIGTSLIADVALITGAFLKD